MKYTTEAADKKLEKIVFESQIYENFYKKAAYQSILKKTKKGLKAAGLYSLATSGYEVLSSEDKTKHFQETAGGFTSALVTKGLLHGAVKLGLPMTGVGGSCSRCYCFGNISICREGFCKRQSR